MAIQDSSSIENINAQIFASIIFLISNIFSLKSTIDLKQQLLTNINNDQIKKTAKFAVSLQLIGTILFLILSYDELDQNPSNDNIAFFNANILSTVATIIRFNLITKDSSSFTGSEDID